MHFLGGINHAQFLCFSQLQNKMFVAVHTELMVMSLMVLTLIFVIIL